MSPSVDMNALGFVRSYAMPLWVIVLIISSECSGSWPLKRDTPFTALENVPSTDQSSVLMCM